MHRRHLSRVDCISFDMMRRLDLQHTLTLDDHLGEQGFDRLPAAEQREPGTTARSQDGAPGIHGGLS